MGRVEPVELEKCGFKREFYGGQGTSAVGGWSWWSNSLQTNYASVTGNGGGYWLNNPATVADGDEYKWSNIFLPKGSYKITIIHIKSNAAGNAKVLLGMFLLGTKDFYNVSTIYEQLWEITFTLTSNITTDLRFKVNGKNTASSNYYVNFSRFVLEKVG